MLAAISIPAIVGGALAFKAQKATLAQICSVPDFFNCPNFNVASTITYTGTERVYWTETFGTNCLGAECPSSTYLTAE